MKKRYLLYRLFLITELHEGFVRAGINMQVVSAVSKEEAIGIFVNNKTISLPKYADASEIRCYLLECGSKWVSAMVRLPEVEGDYFWKGKGSYKGVAHFDTDTQAFEFPDSLPVNKVAPSHLYWLDETYAEYEEPQEQNQPKV